VIIVDTSTWIDHFRGKPTHLPEILGSGDERLHPFVLGELLLNGLPRKGKYMEDLQKLVSAPVSSAAEVAAFIDWAELVGTGVGYVDTHLLLVSARSLSRGAIMTEDRKLLAQAKRLGVAYQP